MKRERNEANYRNTKSTNGEFSPKIGKTTTERLTRYCKDTNQNKTRFVERCINERLDVLETEFLNSLSKEELIELLKNR